MNVVLNVLDMINLYGEEYLQTYLSEFSTEISTEGKTQKLNPDIEIFLLKNAIQFAREKKSITYIVGDKDDGALLGYFTITHKAIEIPATGISKTMVRKLEKHAKLNEFTNSYSISAFLIAQFGKNYGIDHGKRISGSEMMKICERELSEIRYRIGGNVEYLDCEADAKLLNFYEKEGFRLFGERMSEKDGKRYLQYMKFL